MGHALREKLATQLVLEADHHGRTHRPQVPHQLVICRCDAKWNCSRPAHDRDEGHDHLGAVGKEERHAVVRSNLVLVEHAEPRSRKVVQLCMCDGWAIFGDVNRWAISLRKRVEQRVELECFLGACTSDQAALVPLALELLDRLRRRHAVLRPAFRHGPNSRAPSIRPQIPHDSTHESFTSKTFMSCQKDSLFFFFENAKDNNRPIVRRHVLRVVEFDETLLRSS